MEGSKGGSSLDIEIALDIKTFCLLEVFDLLIEMMEEALSDFLDVDDLVDLILDSDRSFVVDLPS